MKEILLLIDTSTASQPRIELAKQYFLHFEGYLTGLLIRPERQLPEHISGKASPDLRQQYDTELNVRIAEAEQNFKQSLIGINEYARCNIEQGNINEILLGYARRSSFVILGQHNPEYQGDPILGKPNHIILHSGRPVVIVPYTKCSTAFPRHIVVAWDGSREATRALYDAMPFLKAADSVILNAQPLFRDISS